MMNTTHMIAVAVCDSTAADIVSFVKEMMDADITIHRTPELACWTVNAITLQFADLDEALPSP